MIVVADAGPLIHLSLIGRLDLLPALYGRVLVPAAVHAEVVVPGPSRPGSSELQGAAWVEVVDVDLKRTWFGSCGSRSRSHAGGKTRRSPAVLRKMSTADGRELPDDLD